MVDRVILACEMIEDEVRLALRTLPRRLRPPVVWIESGLHDRPERLNAALQDSIDRLDEGARQGITAELASVLPGPGPASGRRTTVTVGPVSEVLLALGFCGKGLHGLVSQRLDLVFPRVDDCISLLLNNGCVRERIPRDTRSYYLTQGWFRHNDPVLEAHAEWVRRFGPERAASLRRAMYAGYERVSLIDTKAYDIDDCIERSRAYAAGLSLEHEVVGGSVQLLERLFKGERDSEIVLVPAGEEIGFAHLFPPAETADRSPRT